MKRPETLAEKSARLKALRLAREKAGDRPRERERKVHQLDDALPFGKHKGKSLREVIEDDSSWIIWAMENIADFEISDLAQNELDLVLDIRRGPRAWEVKR